LVNPTWSKVKRLRFGVTAQAFEGGPPEPAGRPLEAVGNGSRRWMVARLDRKVQVTEPGLRADSFAHQPAPLELGCSVLGGNVSGTIRS
jgi:hypothetical protein